MIVWTTSYNCNPIPGPSQLGRFTDGQSALDLNATGANVSFLAPGCPLLQHLGSLARQFRQRIAAAHWIDAAVFPRLVYLGIHGLKMRISKRQPRALGGAE